MSKMIRKMQAKKPVQMTFPTLPNELVKYVWFDPSESEDDNVTFRKMKNSYCLLYTSDAADDVIDV